MGDHVKWAGLWTQHELKAYTDTRRSVSNAVVMLAKGAVRLHLRMQAMVALGTSEVDYVDLSEAVKEVMFLR